MKSVKRLSRYTSILLSVLLMLSAMSPGITALAQEKANAAPTVLNYEDDSITAELKAAEGGALPTGAALQVKALNKDSQDEAEKALYAETEAGLNAKAAGQGTAVNGFIAYSVSLTKDNKDVTPKTGAFVLKVTYKTATAPEAWLNTPSEQKTTQLYQKTEGRDEQNNTVYTMEPQQAENTTITADPDGKVQTVESKLTTLEPVAVTWESTPQADPAAQNDEEQPAAEPIPEPTVDEEPQGDDGVAEELPAEEATEIEDGPDEQTSAGPVNSEIFTNAGPLITSVNENFQSSIRSLLRSRSVANNAEATPLSDSKADDGIELNKTASYNEEDGTYTINLESYVTGKVTTESKPTDIVLVLDQSSSMDEGVEFNKVDPSKVKANPKDVYYIKNKDKDEYYKLTYSNGYYYYNSNYYLPGGQNSGQNSRQFYSATKTRLDALKEAANTLIENVKIESTKDGKEIDNRIAVIGYGMGDDDNNNDSYPVYLNTELFVGDVAYGYKGNAYTNTNKDYVKSAGVQNVGISGQYKNAFQDMSTIKGQDNVAASMGQLTAYGATNADLGMELAEEVLKNNKDGARNHVVIMFTDGEPTKFKDFSKKVADNAIDYSKNIKENATVYTVGLVDGLKPTEDPTKTTLMNQNGGITNKANAMNQYMHYVSSNYPNATKLGNYGKTCGISQPKEEYKQGYFLSAADADSLNEIFENISKQITKPKIEIGTETQVIDYISDYFTLNSEEDIKVYTSDYKGNEEWEEKKLFSGAKKVYDNNAKTITVSNFNYSDNYVAEKTDTEDARGSKLIIELKVRAIDGFIGGNDVSTNKNTTALVNNKDPKKPINKKFPEPEVNVALNYDYDPNDQTIFMGETWNDVQNFFDDKATTGIQYKQGDIVYTIDGKNNAYVEITYQVKDSKGTVVGTYTIPAKATEGAWNEGGPTIDTTKLDKDETYTVTATVTPTVANPSNNNTVTDKAGNVVSSTDLAENLTKQPVIHVVKGQLTITKKITQQYTNIEQINANQTFVFKIERYEVDSNNRKVGEAPAETFYETINFNANGTEKELSKTISGLPKGYYTVTEETSWSPKYNLSNTMDNYTGNIKEAQDLFIGKLEQPATETTKPKYYGLDNTNVDGKKIYENYAIGDTATTTFTNKLRTKNDQKDPWKWLSDTAAAVNVFDR